MSSASTRLKDVGEWLRRDFIMSWRKRETTSTDMNRYNEEQVKPAVAHFEQLKSERSTPNSRAGLLPEARQININPRRLRTKTFEESILLFKLEGANTDIMPRG